MNKKFLSAMLTVAMFFAAGSAFVSCKDYDDDIKNLQSKIDGLQSTINTIQNQITQGYLLTGVTDVTGGVQITLSNGNTYTIKNGENGAQGEKGEKGDKGDKGDTGATGATGAAGKNGTVWTIGEDGYWYKDGEKYTSTAFPEGVSAVGKDGAAGGSGTPGAGGAAGAKGETGNYWMPESDGYFYEYTAAGVKTGKKSDFKWNTGSEGSGTPSVDAAWNSANQTLTLSGLVDSNGNVTSVTISLNGSLASLVKVQHYYLDGIETVVYPWIADTILAQTTKYANWTQTTHHKKTIKSTVTEIYDWTPNFLSNDPKTRTITAADKWIYGPVWPLDYHLNPSNSAVSYAVNQPSYFVQEPDVIYRGGTRAAAATLNITSPEKYGYFTADKAVFGAEKGILTAGLQIEKPQYLEPRPTYYQVNGGANPTEQWWADWYVEGTNNKDNVIALQMKGEDGATITSDYVLLQPSRIDLLGLIWNTAPDYKEPGFGPNATPGTRIGDEKHPSDPRQIYVYDSPEEALDNNDGAALELYLENSTIDLRQYLGINYINEDVINITKPFSIKTMVAKKFDEESWGLHYEFQLVDYEVSGNNTHDSRYVSFCDAAGNIPEYQAAEKGTRSTSGIIRALNVDEKAKTLDTNERNTTSIGREPLVRVLVYNNHKNAKGEYDQVMLDGYILLHIIYTPENINVTKYPVVDLTFDNCNYADYQTNWSQFNDFVLTQTLNGMTKQTFDGFYFADCYDGGTVATADKNLVTANALDLGTASDGNKIYSMRIFNFGDMYGLDANGNIAMPPVRGAGVEETSNEFENAALGTVLYFPNHDNTTNHRWTWRLTKEELEYLTHHKGEKTQVTRWIRYKARQYDPAQLNVTVDNSYAPYPYVWVKMTINLDKEVKKYAYDEKNDNYWFHFNTGASDGWAGWPIDIQAPGNVSIPTIAGKDWNARPSTTLITNKININGKTKYYFAPKTYEITTLEGNTYTITPQSSTADVAYSRLYCKYVVKNSTFNKTPGTTRTVNTTIKADNDAKNSLGYHQWEEDKLETILAQCAINYNAGAFNNTRLYAKNGNVYTLIATITNPEQTKGTPASELIAGNIKLEKNDVAKEVLNAIGYPLKEDGTCDFANSRSNINKQLRAWLGAVHDNGCQVADYVYMKKTDDPNVATFLASWERPINLAPFTPDVLLDANTNENYVFLIDYLHLYDWRGDKGNQGYMYDGHYWFWGYYNVKSITVDMRPDYVTTNMHKDQRAANKEWVKLSEVTTTANLWTWLNGSAYQTGLAAQKTTFTFGTTLSTNYNTADKETALETYMGIAPVNNANKARFGGFYYANNGDNVDEFDIRIPITIEYEWGKLYQTVQWKIKTTHGH